MIQHKPLSGQGTRSSTTLGKATFRLPPIQETVGHGGFGGAMMSKTSQTLMYRSVPPRPFSYTFSDEINSYKAKRTKSRSKTAPMSIYTPRDYMERFKSRPVTKPNVVEIDGGNVFMQMSTGVRCADGFFPPVKLRMLPYQNKGRTTVESPELHLEPISSTKNDSTLDNKKTNKRNSPIQKPRYVQQHIVTMKTQEIPEEKAGYVLGFQEDVSEEDNTAYSVVYPNIQSDKNNECDDLSSLPRPKRIHAKRELPWVFRFKVKKNLNSLTKIMASKTPSSQTVAQSGT